jgi:transposase
MTEEILTFVDWITSKGCTHVAMESTGVLWKPIYNLLELSEINTLVVNAQHIKAVPGRKTDVKDAEWIADLLRHGLLRGSYIPKREQRELRELVRYRRSLIDEHTREVNRIQKILEGANIKLSSVASNIMGVSGRSMLEAITNGIEDPETLAQLSKGVLRQKKEQLKQALRGLIGPHQRMILSVQLKHIDFIESQIEELNKEIAERMRPFDEYLELLDTIPGVGRKAAEHILAEIGTDMDQFPTSAHLASWAGMSPGSNESAGKRKSGKTRKGNKHLRSLLVETAHAVAISKSNYLHTQYHRIASRRGASRAAIAVGHTILVIAYNIIRTKKKYVELGANYYDEQKKEIATKRAIKRLEVLGYKVSIEPTTA